MIQTLEIIGRQSSHFTRMVRIFAAELGLPYSFTPIYDLLSREPGDYAGNPALKLPILRVGTEAVFGSLNICRVLSRRAPEFMWRSSSTTSCSAGPRIPLL